MASIRHNFVCPSSKQKPRLKFRRSKQVRAQAFDDEGRSINLVDENMETLRKRIESVRVKERLQRGGQHGWCCSPGYDHFLKKDTRSSESLHLMVMTCKTFSFTVATSSLLLSIFSIVIHSRVLGN